MNKFKYSDSNKRYHTLDYFYKNKFNSKVFKVSLNGNFTCPNIDGTKGYGGCIYCHKGSSDFGGNKEQSITEQFNSIKNMMLKKWPKAKYIAYFQSNTNTYGPLDKLKSLFEEAISQEGVIGLNIATRADSITEECYDYLEDLSKRTYLTVELGLQTTNEKTAKLINRCHTLSEFEEAVKKLRKRNINVVVHIINGLPYETKEDMLNTVKYLNKLDIQGIKIHMLSVVKDTPLEEMYKKDKFHILTKDEYIDIVVNQLELLREEIVINRITGDPNKDDLIEPTWLLKKFVVMNDIDKEMVRKDTYQGIKKDND
ncbi:MAG: TIGR01212 family radical SAM protein [Bacilli bacterium]|nr:TIGR01212 family radical SAM protein [Bacilli bacterium]